MFQCVKLFFNTDYSDKTKQILKQNLHVWVINWRSLSNDGWWAFLILLIIPPGEVFGALWVDAALFMPEIRRWLKFLLVQVQQQRVGCAEATIRCHRTVSSGDPGWRNRKSGYPVRHAEKANTASGKSHRWSLSNRCTMCQNINLYSFLIWN